MLIKQDRPLTYNLILGGIIVMSLLGGYALLLQQPPSATINLRSGSGSDSASTASAMALHIDANTRVELRYTLLGNSRLVNQTQVIGSGLSTAASVNPKALPFYPAPVTNDSFPRALVVALRYPWSIKPTVRQTQYRTFLADTLPLPVVSLSGPPEYFFGEKGLYSVKNANSENTPYRIHFELIDTNQVLLASTTGEVKVAGYSSKKLPMKSLDIVFSHPLNSSLVFGDSLETPLYSLRLRNAGNDFLLAHMRDAVASHLSRSTHATGLRYRPVVVFINGEFWGLQYLREDISEENLRAKYPKLRREQVQLGELQADNILASSNGFNYLMGQVLDFVEQSDLTQPHSYDSLTRLIDLPNFTDYLILQTFVSNIDWPHNNVKAVFLARKLHFLLYDTDLGFAYPEQYQEQVGNFFDWPDRIHDIDPHSYDYFVSLDHYLPSRLGKLYHRLIEVPDFRNQFIARYRELLRGPLSQSSIRQAIANIQGQISPLMAPHSARWGYPTSVSDWKQNVRQLADFCEQRRPFVTNQLNSLEEQSFPLITVTDRQ